MALFGEVAPVSSEEVIAIGVQQLGVTARGEISWDMVRDTLIREVTFGGTTCPTDEVCRLMAEFLQRLPLPRLVHFLDMILPQMVPVQSPCQSRRRRFASSYRIAERNAWGEWDVEYTLNATKLFWSRSGIMHVAIAWDHKPLLLLATALLPNRTTESFESEAGPPYDKQRIQMGLRSGNTVLICFRSGVGHFQSVLIALAADLHTNKPWQGQHKFWKYVSPIRTYFAWLPERLARTYCSAALDKCPDLPYGEVHHLQGSDADEKHSMVFQNIYHIGDTKSAQELEVFLRMSRERLRLCCGLQCTDRLHPNGPRQRQKLFHAALKLLWFAVGIETVRCENAAQVALHAAIRPLLRLEDGHVLATLSAIVLALCEGRTGLAISGVFGAGKTRSAAVLLAGLLVFDPSLKLMVLTKENIAAHAVAEHLVSLQMPDFLQEKMGRLVGYYEQNRKGSYTPLDILPSNRNQVIRQKSLLIGCGGGFQQECSQQFSPVADWMGSIDLFLEDEGQQYGNMEEAATVARTPATCLEVWSGDHRQTPGGLKKSREAKAFRKKLTKRPLALRCQTQYIQAHDFGNIVMRYLDCPKESFAWKLRQLLTDGSAAIDPAVGQFWHELIGDSPPCLSTEIQRAAYAILWMGLRGEREGLPSMLATTFAEAAGVSGRQKWGLVLSSSARVSQVTYQTVVGVRYPELVTFNGTQWKFGKYVAQERPLRGGFLPIFWDVPRANIHAVEDIGAVVDWLTERCEFQADAKSNLAVLHNRNDMTNLFRASNWVSSSHDSIVSRGVTTCAGMTAHTVLLAQTKVGFLTGGRKKSFLLLSEDEQMVQLEEAYARATVAITRARSLCLIMGPLDMKGLVGAATVMGTLMYGAGHVWAGHAHFYLHDGELSRSPSDETFIHMLQQNCCLSGPHFPPPAIVEALQDYVTHYYKVRRLHLIVVDLWRPWKYNTARAREITDQLWRISHGNDTHRVSPFRPDGPEPPLRCRRFAYGYALDGSEYPSYLVWPQRDGQSYTLLDTSTTDTLPLNHDFFRPLGMEHFYDSFALGSEISVRREALHLFGLRADELLPDLHITRDGVLRIGLGAHQEHRVNHVARATDRTKVSADVIQLAAHEVDTAPEQAVSDGDASDSEGSESASDSDQNDPPSSLVADAEQYELMQIAYAAVGKDFTGQEDLIGSEYGKLQKLEMVPERWPLARLSFSLQTCVDHLDRVLAGCCWEVQATRTTPSESLLSLHQVAKCLTMKLAVHLAKEVAAILRAVLTHETKKLYNDSTVHLLCSNYWIQPIYQELLHSSSRYNATREGERKRPSSGLARVAAYPKPPKQRKPSASGTSFSDWIGGTCYADTLQVWFPAHWAPVVLQQLQQKEDNYRAENPSWMDQEEPPADILKQWREARANRRMQFKVGKYRDGSWESNIRMLTGTIKVDWIQLPVEPYLAALPTLQQGVIAGVFRQKGAAPWGCTRAEKLQLSVLLPNDLSLEDWYAEVYGLPTVWPETSMLGADNLRKIAGYDFHLLRKKYDVRTMWGDLDPQWRLLQSQLETRGPGWYSPAELKERLFTNKSKRPGDDTKEALRTDGNTIAWQAWDTARNIIWQSCQPGPPLVFPGEKEIFRAMYAQVGEEEQVISPPYTRTPLDASMRGRKKRKQGEDNALVG